MGFVKVGQLSEVPVDKMKISKVGEKEYSVANVNGNYCAIGDKCTHASAERAFKSPNAFARFSIFAMAEGVAVSVYIGNYPMI